jgi:hypothetical protein
MRRRADDADADVVVVEDARIAFVRSVVKVWRSSTRA